MKTTPVTRPSKRRHLRFFNQIKDRISQGFDAKLGQDCSHAVTRLLIHYTCGSLVLIRDNVTDPEVNQAYGWSSLVPRLWGLLAPVRGEIFLRRFI